MNPDLAIPEGGFYCWSQTPGDDEHFASALYREYNVTVLPGSYLARFAHGRNPDCNFVRMALVAPLAECLEAAQQRLKRARKNAARGQLAQKENASCLR